MTEHTEEWLNILPLPFPSTGLGCASVKLQGVVLPVQHFKRGSVWSENLCWWPCKGEHICSLAFVALATGAYFCFAQLVNLAMPLPRSEKNPQQTKFLSEGTSFSTYSLSVDLKPDQAAIKHNHHLCETDEFQGWLLIWSIRCTTDLCLSKRHSLLSSCLVVQPLF